MTNASPLETVPDLTDWDTLQSWLAQRLAMVDAIDARGSKINVKQFVHATLRSSDLVTLGNSLGRFYDDTWRREVIAVLLADWSCFRIPHDQVDLSRLLFVTHAFPNGFRLFWADSPELGGWFPVGYTGWYPIPPPTFSELETGKIEDRAWALPIAAPGPPHPLVYIFNYSIIAPLRKTEYSRSLLQLLAADIVGAAGLTAITVSGDGSRVAERFGMRAAGKLPVKGAEDDTIYCLRRSADPASTASTHPTRTEGRP